MLNINIRPTVCTINVKGNNVNQRIWGEDEDNSESCDKEPVKHSCKESLKADRDQRITLSMTPHSSSIDTHTPDELRDISLICSPEDAPAAAHSQAVTLYRRRVSNLPIFITKSTDKGKPFMSTDYSVTNYKSSIYKSGA